MSCAVAPNGNGVISASCGCPLSEDVKINDLHKIFILHRNRQRAILGRGVGEEAAGRHWEKQTQNNKMIMLKNTSMLDSKLFFKRISIFSFAQEHI